MCRSQTTDAAANDGNSKREVRKRRGEGRHDKSFRTSLGTPPSPFHTHVTLPDMPAGVPGPVRARVGAESPLEREREREIVLRVDAIVADADLVGNLRSRGQPATY